MFEFIKKKLYKSYCDISFNTGRYFKSSAPFEKFHKNYYFEIRKGGNDYSISNPYNGEFITDELTLIDNVLTFKYNNIEYTFDVETLSNRSYELELKYIEEQNFEDNILKIKNFKNDIKNVDPRDVFENLVRKTFDPFTEFFPKVDDETRSIYSTYVCEKLIGIHYNFMTKYFKYTCSARPPIFPDYIKSYVESCVCYMKSYNNINFELLKKIDEILRKDS